MKVSPELARELGRLRRRGLWVVSTLEGGMLRYWTAVDGIRELYARAGVRSRRARPARHAVALAAPYVRDGVRGQGCADHHPAGAHGARGHHDHAGAT